MPKGIPRKTSGIRYQHTITVGRKFGKNRVIKMEAKPSRVTSTVVPLPAQPQQQQVTGQY